MCKMCYLIFFAVYSPWLENYPLGRAKGGGGHWAYLETKGVKKPGGTNAVWNVFP